jgi:hypothetical protein
MPVRKQPPRASCIGLTRVVLSYRMEFRAPAMPTVLGIVDFDDALLIRAKRMPSLTEAIVSAAAAGGFAGIAVFRFVAMPVMVAIALLAGLLGFLWAIRKRNAELRVTNLEFRLRGRVGDEFGSARSVCRADIRWLEYQEDTSGPETSHHPGGLYAVLLSRSICMLPDIDERQTAVVIERIFEKFPDFRDQWRRNSPYGQHFTTLGLDGPNS